MAKKQTVTGTPYNLDDKIQRFLENKVNSFVKWDLVRFFHDNPHTRDTAENIANYIGRDVPTIAQELNELVAVKVLRADTVSGQQIFELSNDKATRETIHRFMEACHDREFRVKAIHHVQEVLAASS